MTQAPSTVNICTPDSTCFLDWISVEIIGHAFCIACLQRTYKNLNFCTCSLSRKIGIKPQALGKLDTKVQATMLTQLNPRQRFEN